VKIAQWTFLVITTGELNIYPEISIWLTSNILDAVQEGLKHTQTFSFSQTEVKGSLDCVLDCSGEIFVLFF
jgi:hypothetical protein